MFSGKTEMLLSLMRKNSYTNHSCIIIKHEIDNRHDSSEKVYIQSHAGAIQLQSSSIKIIKIKNLSEILDVEEDVIGIDEGQFFPDIADICDKLANKGKTVIIAALDGDFTRKMFNGMEKLIPLCDDIIKLNAICTTCKQRSAIFTRRLIKNQETIIIGSDDIYEANCRICYNTNNK